MQLSLLAAIATAGSAGAVCRHLLAELVRSWCGTFPLHTLVVNVAGCLGFGIAFGCGHGRWSPTVSAAVLVGFFGAFTTFSSFAFDCVQLLETRRLLALAVDVVAQNGLGLLGLVAGIALGRWFVAA